MFDPNQGEIQHGCFVKQDRVSAGTSLNSKRGVPNFNVLALLTMALIGLALESHSKPRQNVSMQPFILHATTAIIFCKFYLKKYTILFINSC